VALRRRLDDFLFRPVFQDAAEFRQLKSLLREGALEQIERQGAQRANRRTKRVRQGVVVDLIPNADRTYDISMLWLLQASMRSHVGAVRREDSDEPIELAKDLALLSPGYALTEFGNMLRLIAIEGTGDPASEKSLRNPLNVYDDVRVRLLYLFAVLKADIIFVAMLDALSRAWNVDTALARALDSLTNSVESGARLDEVAEAKDLFKLRERIQKVWSAADGTTEKPVEKAQQVPRLEFAVDLGFLDRHTGSGAHEDGTYMPTACLDKVNVAFGTLFERPSAASAWLDRQFFKAAGMVYGQPVAPCDDPDLRLLYFARGAAFLKRRVGFIPGRIAATLACLSAWIDGRCIEIGEMFEELYRVPKGRWGKHIQFSGGSRLDSEFLVGIDPELEARLAEATGASGQ
jgi:hypothetical protein